MPLDMTSLAGQLAQLELSPYLALSNMAVCALTVKADLGAGAVYFSRKNPLACWISNLLYMFSSQLIANLLLNEPIVASLSSTRQVISASLIWYIIYYSPFDIVYRLAQFTPFKLIIFCTNEIYIVQQISAGIAHANKIYPKSPIVVLVIGIARGNGAGIARILDALARSSWSVSLLELMHPTYETKAAIAASCLLIVNDATLEPALGARLAPLQEFLGVAQPADSPHLLLPAELLVLCIVLAAVYVRASVLLLDVTDPFEPLEALVCGVLFGGVWDGLARALATDEPAITQHHQQRRDAGPTLAPGAGYMQHAKLAGDRRPSLKSGALIL